MRHYNAVALLKPLKNMLAVCLDEYRLQGSDFNRREWAALRDPAESPAFVKAFAKLDESKEDRALVAEIAKMIADVVCVVQVAEQDLPPEEVQKRLREACPLFGAEICEEADVVKQIRTATAAKSAPTKRPVMLPMIFDAISNWADIEKIQAKTGFTQKQIERILSSKRQQSKLERRTGESGQIEFRLKEQ